MLMARLDLLALLVKMVALDLPVHLVQEVKLV